MNRTKGMGIMKNLFKLFLILLLCVPTLISCTSNKTEDGKEVTEAEAVAEGEEGLDNLDAELDGEGAEAGEGEEGFDEEGGDEEVALDDGEEGAADKDEFFEEGDEAGEEFADDGAGEEDKAAVAETGDEASSDAAEPLVDDSSGGEEFASEGDDAATSDVAEADESSAGAGFSEVEPLSNNDADAFASNTEVKDETEKTWVPVKKMATTPFNKAGQLLNTIYIVRDGDTIQSVSEKIYGMDKSSELLAANPHLNRSFRVGDKMYYNSPNRSADSSQIITYYEDNGIPAQTYMSQPGDNIRSVAQSLMGHSDSWKEVWATNMSVESKGDLPDGTELRYFPNGAAPAAPAQNLAQNDMPPPVEEPQAAVNDLPPPVPEDPAAAAGMVEPPPPPPVEPPPPPPVEPPPPPPVQQAKMTKKGGKGPFSNMKLILAAILLIGGGLAILIIQKNKSKKMNIGETQI